MEEKGDQEDEKSESKTSSNNRTSEIEDDNYLDSAIEELIVWILSPKRKKANKLGIEVYINIEYDRLTFKVTTLTNTGELHKKRESVFQPPIEGSQALIRFNTMRITITRKEYILHTPHLSE